MGGEGLFNCETCDLRLRAEGLSSNAQCAMDAYRALAHAVVRDLHLTPLVFDIHRWQMTARDAKALLRGLEACHEHALEQARETRDRESPDDEGDL